MDDSDWDTMMPGSDPCRDPLPNIPTAHGQAGLEYNDIHNNATPSLPPSYTGSQHSNNREAVYWSHTDPQQSIYRRPVGHEFEAGQVNLATGQGVPSTSSQSVELILHNPEHYRHCDPGNAIFNATPEQATSGRSPVLLRPPCHLHIGQVSGYRTGRIHHIGMGFEPTYAPLGADGGIIPTDSTEQPGGVLGEFPTSSTTENPWMPCEVHVSRSRKKPKGKERSRATRKDWADWKKYLQNLYLKEDHTAFEIAFEMGAIHEFEASVSTYQKRFKEWSDFVEDEATTADTGENAAEPRRRRAAVLPQQIVSSLFFHLILKPRSGVYRVPSITEEPYVHQRRMFHALDGLVKALFAARTNPWTSNSFAFLPPGGVSENSRTWKLLSEKCSGIATVSTAMVGPVTGLLFRQVLDGLDSVTQSRDPNFLVHFWKMCLELSGIRLRTRARPQEFIFLRVFLRCLRYMFGRSFAARDDLLVVIDSLTQILEHSPRDLKTSLGLGCWKVTHVLGDMIGADHAIVLGLGVYCTKQWNTKFAVDLESLAPRYERLLDQTGTYYGQPQPDVKISVLYDYSYALLKGKYNSTATRERATQLWNLSVDVCRRRAHLGSLRYTLATRAFVFAADVLAVHELETWHRGGEQHNHCREASFGFMDKAIEILKHGDLECQVTAAHFSKRLALWLKSYCPGPKVDPERLQASRKAAQGRKWRSAGRIKGERGVAEKRRTAEILAKISRTWDCAAGGTPGDPAQNMSKNNRWRRQKRAKRDLLVEQVVTEGQSDGPLTRGESS